MLDSKKPSNLIKRFQANDVELKVTFLDDKVQVFGVKKRCLGKELLQQVLDFLNASEREYFDIEIVRSQPNDSFTQWIDPNKPVVKYVTKDDRQNCKLQFRVKYFITDPSHLQEDFTRHQFYLQMRRDIYLKHLECAPSTQFLLCSYVVQAELGDYNAIEHDANYLRGMDLAAGQTSEMEYCISEHHRLHRGLTPTEAEYNYLEHATRIPLYGVYFFKSKDSMDKDMLIGVTTVGTIVYQNEHVVNEFSWSKMIKISFKRRTFFMELKRELSEDYNTVLGFKLSSQKHAKALWKACVDYHTFFRLNRNATAKSTSKQSKKYFTCCNVVQKNGELGEQPTHQQHQQQQQHTQLQQQQQSTNVIEPIKCSQTIAENRLNEKACGANAANAPASNGNGNGNGNNNGKLSLLAIPKTHKTYDKQMEAIPRMAWEQQNAEPEAPQPIATDYTHNINVQLNDKNVITVCMEADEQGRFGFNVRGGVDVNLPVLVARIAQHSSADRVVPKIKEGDQVLLINGHDVSNLTHDQVVSLIKRTHEHGASGQLVLTIRPMLSDGCTVGEEEEPICQYVPDNYLDVLKIGGSIFSQSLFLLHDGLASGALLDQFEQLYKSNSNLPISEARKDDNHRKNRYRDILPYDCNRVVVASAADTDTDYINANYVNMIIPNDCVNRYIATQGPLPNTLNEFWRMVQQESSNFIVMLTTIIERGRMKCQHYWPANVDEEMELSPSFSLKLIDETTDATGSYVLRNIALNDKVTGEYRVVRQLQYLAWPDHGVPADRELFMSFVNKMREMRQENMNDIDQRFKQLQLLDVDASDISPEEICKRNHRPLDDDIWMPTSVHQYISAANPPMIVHCSAGIGRTGMLILMDTALSLMHMNEPIYPLDILKNMRDQRPCMVQNVFQYKFICECIFATYAELTSVDGDEDKSN